MLQISIWARTPSIRWVFLRNSACRAPNNAATVQTSSPRPLPWLRRGRTTTKCVRNQAHSSKCREIEQVQWRCPISHTQHSVTHTLWWRSATWETHLHIVCTKRPSVHNYSAPVNPLFIVTLLKTKWNAADFTCILYFFFFVCRHIYGDGKQVAMPPYCYGIHVILKLQYLHLWTIFLALIFL